MTNSMDFEFSEFKNEDLDELPDYGSVPSTTLTLLEVNQTVQGFESILQGVHSSPGVCETKIISLQNPESHDCSG